MQPVRVSDVNLALQKPQLSSGVSTGTLAAVWAPSALAAVFTGTSVGWIWSLIPVVLGFVLHTIARWVFAKDYRVVDIYMRYSQLPFTYHPNVREKLPTPFERPVGFGRDLRL